MVCLWLMVRKTLKISWWETTRKRERIPFRQTGRFLPSTGLAEYSVSKSICFSSADYSIELKHLFTNLFYICMIFLCSLLSVIFVFLPKLPMHGSCTVLCIYFYIS